MYKGKIVEEGSVKEVLTQPQDPYTKLLLSSVLTVEANDCSLCCNYNNFRPGNF
ncbi:ABC transporter ATP-binding protein [Desulfosporosinus shakirovi]|uniref:ABC transporter ATP-binding protein n=1 Tax=Desulfosporosinus shakirovi TaxID=2885154 RepID=UPI0037BF68BE